MIERPTPVRAGITQAGAEKSKAMSAAPPEPSSALPDGERVTHGLAANGPDPALATPAPPKFAGRAGSRFESATARPPARRKPRSSITTEGMTYRAIFACCREAKDTPTT